MGFSILGSADYYELLVKYQGDLAKATAREIINLLSQAGINPDKALAEARYLYNNRGNQNGKEGTSQE